MQSFLRLRGEKKSNQTRQIPFFFPFVSACQQLHTWETGWEHSTQCCCLKKPRSQNRGLSHLAVPQLRREGRIQKSRVSGSALGSSSIQDPHGCPSSATLPSWPVWLDVSFALFTASPALSLACFAASIAHGSELLPTFTHHLPLLLGALEIWSVPSIYPILQLN